MDFTQVIDLDNVILTPHIALFSFIRNSLSI